MKNNKKNRFMILAAILLITISIGISYAFFSAKVKEMNKTESVIGISRTSLK